MKLGLSLKEECEARMKRSSTRDSSSRKRHIRSRHRSSSSSSSSSRGGSRKRRSVSVSSSSSYGSRSRRRSRRSGHRRGRSRSGSDRSVEPIDKFGRRLNPSNVTNSKDPKAVASRIFIGSLPTTDLSRDDIDARFSKYGRILGITLLTGYGFIQFSEEDEAIRAVEGEKDSVLKGHTIDVKLASEGKGRKGHGHSDEGHHRRSSRESDYPHPPYPYPEPYSRGLPPPPHIDPYRGAPLPPMDPYIRGPPPPPHLDPYHRGPPPPPFHRGMPLPGDPFGRGPPFDPYGRGRPPPVDPFRRPYPEPYPYPSAGYGPTLPPPPPTVDCEIIVLEEKQRSYADSIKKRLMSAGIVTEMNLLPSSVDILTALEEATRRRLLFAIVVNDQNEIHRSITVNILHGLTQEHRNMPMEDAITLVTRSYDKYMLEKQERIASEKGKAEDAGTKKCPDFLKPTANTLYLLNLLADNRYLTVDELDTVVDYLQLRRDRLVKSFSGSSSGSRPVGPTTPPLPIRKSKPEDLPMSGVGMKQHEPDLKSILGMIHTEKNTFLEAAKPVESYNTSNLSSSSSVLNTSINFNNPTVQQALDNLINSGPSLLRSLSDVSKVPGGVPMAVSRPYEEKGPADPYDDWETGYGADQQYRGGIY